MKRVFVAFAVVALFIFVVAVAPTLAHCGKAHEGEGRIYVAQNIDDADQYLAELVSEAVADEDYLEEKSLEKLLAEQEQMIAE